MSFLPIAQRELRVAARQRATHRWRLISGLAAAAVAAGVGLIAYQMQRVAGAQPGIWIFNVLKWMAFLLALLAGVFFTSDCLSEEKREGTLGLLFLTDLRGHDVALGKLLSTSLRPFYSLLAVFPVMGLAFLLGGVASREFWETLVAICNALFFSLALGMAISVVSRDAIRAMTATGLAMTALLFVVPQADWAHLGRWRPELLSPAFAFLNAGAYRAWDFWVSALTLNIAGWCLLVMASWLAPRTWQQKATRAPLKARGRILKMLAPSRAPKLRAEDPIAWVISRDRWSANIARLAVAVILFLMVTAMAQGWRLAATTPASPPVTVSSMLTNGGGMTTYTNGAGVVTFSYSASSPSSHSTSYVVMNAGVRTQAFRAASMCVSALSWLLELWLATVVSRFYLEGRKNGFLELLLVTPTTPEDVVRSHWRALRQMFLLPMAAQLVAMLGVGALGIMATASGGGMPASLQALIVCLGGLTWTTSLFAIAWFSIWLGMTSKSLTTVILKIFCYLKVFPWMGASFVFGVSAVFLMRALGGSVTTGGGLTRANIMFFLFAAIPQGLAFLATLGLLALGRSRTPQAFRDFTNAARA